MNKDKRNNIQLLGTFNNADESGIIANANQVYDANEDKSTQDVSKEHKERIKTLETKESSMQTTLENITKTGEASAASNVTYNHNASKLDATNIQDSVDELYKKSNIITSNGETKNTNDVFKCIDNTEFIYCLTDNENKLLVGIKNTGEIYWGYGVNNQVKEYIEHIITLTNDALKEVDNKKVDKEENKSLIDSNYASSISNIESDEFRLAITDSDNRILFAIKKDGNIRLVNKEIGCTNIEQEVLNNDYLYVILDATSKILFAIKDDGTPYFANDVYKNEIDNNTKDIQVNKTAIETIQTNLAKEISSRESAISNLNVSIDEKLSNITSKEPTKISFQQLDTDVQQRISSSGTSINNLADNNWLYNKDDVITLKSTETTKFVDATIISLDKDTTLDNKNYIINHTIDLKGHSLTCNSGTTLSFFGGKLINSTDTVSNIKGNGAGICAANTQIFSGNITFDNNWNVPFKVEWFGAKSCSENEVKDKTAFDSYLAIQHALDCGRKEIVANGIYYISQALNLTKGSIIFTFNIIYCNGAYNALNITNNNNRIKGNELKQLYLRYNTTEERASKSAGIRFYGNSYNCDVNIWTIEWFGRGIWFNPRVGDGGNGSTSYAGIQYIRVQFGYIISCEEGIVFDTNENKGHGLWITEIYIKGGRIGGDIKNYYNSTLDHKEYFCNYGIRHLHDIEATDTKYYGFINGNNFFNIGFEALNIPIGELRSWENCYFYNIRMAESITAYSNGKYFPLYKLTKCNNIKMSLKCGAIVNTGLKDNIYAVSGTTSEDLSNLVGNNFCKIDIHDRIYLCCGDSARVVNKNDLYKKI